MDEKSYYHDTAETIMWNDRHRMKTNALQNNDRLSQYVPCFPVHRNILQSRCINLSKINDKLSLVFQYIETFFNPDALT